MLGAERLLETPAFPNPPPLFLHQKEGKTAQSSCRVATVTIFGRRAVPDVELAGAACRELGQLLQPRAGRQHRGAPGQGHPAAPGHRLWDAA